MNPPSTAQHSRQFKAALAEFLKNRNAKKSSPSVEQKTRNRMQAEIQYLDKNALSNGDTRDEVRKLLGNPYGEWGGDSWLYPGAERNQFFRIDFQGDRVAARYFTTILDAESGR
jgi:hypothetical protein